MNSKAKEKSNVIAANRIAKNKANLINYPESKQHDYRKKSMIYCI